MSKHTIVYFISFLLLIGCSNSSNDLIDDTTANNAIPNNVTSGGEASVLNEPEFSDHSPNDDNSYLTIDSVSEDKAEETLCELAEAEGKSVVYVMVNAEGSQNGTSWRDAYRDFQRGLDVLGQGDVLCSDAPASFPFSGGYLINGVDNVSIYTDQGPSGVTWLSGGTKSSNWVDEGFGIFSLSLSTEPSFVVYDFKQDDSSGTVTGIDTTRSLWQQAKNHAGLSNIDLLPWYGFLRKARRLPRTPREGEYGFVANTLFVNPTGDVTELNDVFEKAEYVLGDRDGLEVRNSNGSLVVGNLKGRLFASSMPGVGYTLRGRGLSQSIFDGVHSIASGFHAVGIAGSSGSGNSIKNVVAHSGTVWSPFVFYSDITLTDAKFTGEKLSFIAYPHLDENGRTLLDLSASIYSGSTCFSHTDGVATIDGIDWKDVTVFDATGDVSDQLDNRHLVDGYSGGVGIGYNDSFKAPSVSDPESFTVRGDNFYVIGLQAQPDSRVYWKNSHFNRSGYGNSVASTGLSASEIGAWGAGNHNWYFESTKISTGNFKGHYFSRLAEEDGVSFNFSEIIVSNAGVDNSYSLVECIDSDSDIRFNSSTIRLLGVSALISLPNGDFDISPYCTSSDGNNVFFANTSINNSNSLAVSRNGAWWQLNIIGGSQDTFVQ